jgi:3-methyladenine DNA glycosylase Mpg
VKAAVLIRALGHGRHRGDAPPPETGAWVHDSTNGPGKLCALGIDLQHSSRFTRRYQGLPPRVRLAISAIVQTTIGIRVGRFWRYCRRQQLPFPEAARQQD